MRRKSSGFRAVSSLFGLSLACLVVLGCPPGEPTGGASGEGGTADGSTAARAKIELETSRDTRAADSFYPEPVEVGACLDLVEAGELDRARAVCEEARRKDPGNTRVRAALDRIEAV